MEKACNRAVRLGGSSNKNINEFVGKMVRGGEESLILDGYLVNKINSFG